MTARRVVLVTTHYPPLVGGAASYFAGLAHSLAAAGERPVVLTTLPRDAAVRENVDGVEIRRNIIEGASLSPISRKWLQAAQTFIALRRLHRADRVHVVHTHASKSVTVGAAAFSAFFRVPIVFDVQDFFSRSLVIRRGFCPRWVATGSAIAAHLAALGVDRRRILTIPSIPPDGAWTALPPRSETRARSVLFVGELSHAVKGTDVLLRAFAIARRSANLELELIGDGDDRAIDEAFVKANGLEVVVRFAGRRPLTEVLRALDQAGLLVVASRSEGVPRIILEAFVRGVPVVATAVGGIPEVVREGVTGILVPRGDAEALAAAIVRVTGDPLLASTLVASALRWVRTLPDWRQLASLIASSYEDAR